eukprot:scaffold1421_cov293-Prasinococcus_capsulatus_cf.AAC.4
MRRQGRAAVPRDRVRRVGVHGAAVPGVLAAHRRPSLPLPALVPRWPHPRKGARRHRPGAWPLARGLAWQERLFACRRVSAAGAGVGGVQRRAGAPDRDAVQPGRPHQAAAHGAVHRRHDQHRRCVRAAACGSARRRRGGAGGRLLSARALALG